MYDELTEQDIKKMEEEIEYRKLVVLQRGLRGSEGGKSAGRLK